LIKSIGNKTCETPSIKVWRNAWGAGIDGQSVRQFEAREEQQLQELSQELRTQLISQWMQAAQLQLHPQKTKIIDATQPGGFEFLGYHFERGYKWPRAKSQHKLRETLRQRTRRTNGQSLECIIAGLNPVLRGWYNYFRHGKIHALKNLDGWVRGRLRSVLRKRTKRKGKAKGWDHHRWPNRFFDEAGLFNLTTARAGR
jgi:RNA-directed DNA polymerase